ncbi:MAG: lamin tail domain-containing protein, partial [Planctomycetes bacterium]|nr:lamin tail domain-containing protein [Planctomycetota bacterium]
MQKFNSLRSVTGLILLFAVCCGGSVTADWMAYNDSIRTPGGDGTAENVTSWTVYNGSDPSLSTGLLKDFATGLDTGATVTFSMDTDKGLHITSNAGGNPAPGTDADAFFYDIVDLDGYLVYYGDFGWSVDIVFTGLRPTSKYTFVGTAIHTTSNPQRQTMVTLSGHVSAVNNSSSGIVAADDDTAIFLAGGNNTDDTGYVVRWDDIKVADDGLGSFTVNARASDYTNSLSDWRDQGRAYPLGAFMLMEIDDSASYCPRGDLDENCLVDMADLLIFGGSWLDTVVGGANLDDQGDVDGADLAIMADNWQLNAQTGSLRVVFDDPIPPDARWRVDGGEWKPSGYFEWGLSVGLHTVTFSDATDWITPQPRDVQVDYNQTTRINQAYPPEMGTLRVTITAEDPAVVDDARWRVDEGDWLPSGAVVELPVWKSHGVEFMPLPGWITPANREAWIFVDEQTELSGRYEPAPTLLINEIMASNTSAGGVPDPQDGQYYDWFEIYNTTGSAIDVGGMYVADSQDVLWPIPTGYTETIIPAGGYLWFWAAGNEHGDRPLYVGFRLDADGDTLSLYDVDGTTLIDRIIIDNHVSNKSYGRYPDGAPELFFFASASPGASNNGADTFDGHVADTKFSHDRGFYDDDFDVTITTATPNATIYYTLNGSDPINPNGTPTSDAIKYASPVTITTTKSLRAAATKTGWLPTNIDTQSYIFLDDVLRQDDSQLPPAVASVWWGKYGPDWDMDPDVISTEPFTDDDGITFDVKDALLSAPTMALTMSWDDWFGTSNQQGLYLYGDSDSSTDFERICSAELISPDSSEDGFQANCTVQITGGSSPHRWKMDKLSMRLKFRQRLNNGTPTGGPGWLDYKLFPDSKIDSFNTIVLDARMNMSWAYGGGVTPTFQREHAQYTRDQFPGDIQNAMGGYAPHGRPVHLYLNGVYWGIYLAHERPDGAFASSYLGGEKDDYDVMKHNNGTGSVVGFDDDWPAKMQAAANYEALVNTGSNYQALLDLLDIDDFIDYMIMNFYIGNTDWSHQNWYASRSRVDPGGKWRYHNWDPEHCMEQFEEDVTDGRSGDNDGPYGVHEDVANNSEYRLRFADRVHRHFFNNGVLEPNNIAALYQRQIDMLDRTVVAESVRWGDNQRTVPYSRDDEWITERDRLFDDYFPYRSGKVFNQIKNRGLYPDRLAPVFNIGGQYQHGGTVDSGNNLLSIDNPNAGGNIYYTLDGSDPRQTGGAPVGTLYSTQIPLTRSVIAKARVLDGGIWSALNEATFGVGPVADDLRITEIMYHPTDPTQAEKNAAGDQTLIDEDFEYIELKNIGTAAINLNLVHFTDGIDFTFGDYSLGAGQFAVVVKNQAAFEARYPGVSPVLIAGTYTGALDNDGEEIVMRDALGAEIHDFDYND